MLNRPNEKGRFLYTKKVFHYFSHIFILVIMTRFFRLVYVLLYYFIFSIVFVN